MGKGRSALEGLVNMDNSMNSLQVSIWLLPKDSESESLSRVIKSLAQKFDSPLFEPHVTLYSVKIPAENLISLKENLKNRVKDFDSLTLNLLGIGQNGALFKTLYLQLQNSKELNNLYEIIRTVLGKYGDYEIDPHLSLLYKEGLTSEEKTKSVENIEFSSEINFDKIAIKVSGANDNFGKNISKWTYSILN